MVNPEKEKYLLAIGSYLHEIKHNPNSNLQERFRFFINYQIHPFIKENATLEIVAEYFVQLDARTHLYTKEQMNLNNAIDTMNEELSYALQLAQNEAQSIFPNYYNLTKSDGVEYNLFVGNSIAPQKKFEESMLPDFRFWQLETISNAMKLFAKIKPTLAYPIDVAALILAYNQNIDMKFRMDEKRFDIEGAASSQYEIIKKRLEKALIKNSTERLTQAGKIVIAYLDENSRKEHLSLIHKLEHKYGKTIPLEDLEIENLQGITGLRALRISVL